MKRVGLAMAVIILAGCGSSASAFDVETTVRASIEKATGVKVTDISCVRKQGSEYECLVDAEKDGATAKGSYAVTCDAKQCLWRLEQLG